MPTSPYFLKDGTRVPGVTTVISGCGWNTDVLMKWAWRKGKEGVNWEVLRQKAADAGTIAHDMSEAHLVKREFSPPDNVEQDVMRRAVVGYNSFLRWYKSTTWEPVATEFPLVSERYRVGGTPDVLWRDNGVYRLGDWKTSAGVYVEHLIQLAAYVKLIEEVMHIEVETVEPLALGRRTARFSHYSIPVSDLLPAWQAFTRLRELYDLHWAVDSIMRN